MRRIVGLVLVLGIASAAEATPPEPKTAHPRMLLDAELRAEWKAMAAAKKGPVQGSIVLCEDARDTAEHDNGLYQGSEWARVLQGCLVAWAATNDASFAKTAIRFMTALLDDFDRIGDGQGGDKGVQRDRGYVIRNIGPYTALAYDWLHDKLTPEQRAKARKRWAAWLDWYKENGYRPRTPGTNYQAGYLLAATMIAIAQAGEDERNVALWAYVADELWGKDMAAAFASGGILDGGDWPEGWQYGPLSVTSYALAARVAKRAGIPVQGVDTWLASMLRRHVYGLTPGDRVWAGADTEEEAPYLEPAVNTLNAMSLGDASPEVKRWAKGELARMKLADKDSLLHSALAAVGERATLVPRASWPTWYAAPATGTVFARTRWDEKAVWFVAECAPSLDVDHRQPKTGNFVLSRGKDDAIVDPSPYGALSTLTSNAPTVLSDHLPENYKPSQGVWGEKSGWDWATQTKGGVVATRCDYSDQYRFQHRPSDVPEALRDLVLLPNADGTDATLVVVDRANTTAEKRSLFVRFRVPGMLELANDAGSSRIGSTQLAIANLSGNTVEKGLPSGKDCFAEGVIRGRCDAARFSVTDYRVVVPGPKPRAVHAVSVTGGAKPATTKLGEKTWAGVRVAGVRDAVVVWPNEPRSAFTYRAPKGAAVTHVVLDAPETSGKTSLVATADADACVVNVKAGGDLEARPAIVVLDANCQVAADPQAASAATGLGTKPAPVRAKEATRRSGCCAAQTTPGAPIVMTLVVLAAILRPRSKTTRRRSARRSRSASSCPTSSCAR